jgi:hypothetical protein
MWRPRRTFKGVMRWRMKDPPDFSDALSVRTNGKRDADRDTDLHGMASKLLGVEGAKVLESEKDAPTQDFVLADQPVFFIRDLADYF